MYLFRILTPLPLRIYQVVASEMVMGPEYFQPSRKSKYNSALSNRVFFTRVLPPGLSGLTPISRPVTSGGKLPSISPYSRASDLPSLRADEIYRNEAALINGAGVY